MSPENVITANALDQKSSSSIRWRVIEHSGLDFKQHNGEDAWLLTMIETLGCGVGILDFDRDGLEDIFLPGGGKFTSDREILYSDHGLFQGTGQQRFRPVSVASRVQRSRCYASGVNVGDFDQDGYSDVVITGYGGQQLFRNMGDGTFEDVTETVGLLNSDWSASSAWGDFNGDGQLDLYISHYARWAWELEKPCFSRSGQRDRCVPTDFEGEQDELLFQSGTGTFENQSAQLANLPSRGLGVAVGDWDRDGDTDIFVVNDVHPNLLFLNDGQGNFRENGGANGVALGSRSVPDGSMGIAIGDFNRDGLPDFLVTNYQDEYCELYCGRPNGFFQLATRPAGLMGLGSRNVCWGTSFLDADLDGDEDLIVVAGHTSRYPSGSTNLQLPYMLENLDGKRLINRSDVAGKFFQTAYPARGLAVGDLDGDGLLDCIVSMVEQPPVLLGNDSDRQGHFLNVHLIGTKSNRDAIGARVECEIDGQTLHRFRFSGGSYGSSNSPKLHFGLGRSQNVRRLTVYWPSGSVSSLNDLTADQELIIIEPTL